jgi:hypothetical protein
VGSLLAAGGAGGPSWAGAMTSAGRKSTREPSAPRMRPAARVASRVHVGTTSQAYPTLAGVRRPTRWTRSQRQVSSVFRLPRLTCSAENAGRLADLNQVAIRVGNVRPDLASMVLRLNSVSRGFRSGPVP